MDFKPIKGFERLYLVSDTGVVWSNHRNRPLKPSIDRYGYYKVVLRRNGMSFYTTVHRLVARAFLPNPDNKPAVNHINENKLDNRVENLEWVTAEENDNHGTRNERMAATKSRKPVIREVNGKLEHFMGVKDASRKTGIAHSQIARFCRDSNNPEWRYDNGRSEMER